MARISDQESIPTDQIVLMFKDKAVATSESPESIGYIQGLVLSKTKINLIYHYYGTVYIISNKQKNFV